MKKENFSKKAVTLESIDAKFDLIDSRFDALDAKMVYLHVKLDTKIDDLTVITAKSFEGIHLEMNKLEERLGEKIDYRFDSLSNCIDDLALNKVSYEAHGLLAKRVTTLEKGSNL